MGQQTDVSGCICGSVCVGRVGHARVRERETARQRAFASYVAIGEAPGRWRVGVLVFLCACRPYYIKRRVCLMNIGVPIAYIRL